ncbi:PIN-like domain-containing protein [Flavobacterium sp. J372]|nr:PIN-like domain-containing protein [Flavobacterium sp. J372]
MKEFDHAYNNLLSKIKELNLSKRHSVINPESILNDDLTKSVKDNLKSFLRELEELNENQLDVNENDSIQQRILEIFAGKIGTSFDKSQLEAIYSDGEKRYKDEIPPGYKDASKENEKPNFYLFEDKRYLRQYGDLVIWKEIIQKTKAENLKYVIFVTDDNKKDWWTIRRGKTLGPRYELLNEIYFEAEDLKLFHMYDSHNFMKYSKENLEIDIRDESIAEAKDIIESVEHRVEPFKSVNLENLLTELSSRYLLILRMDKKLRYYNFEIPQSQFISCLTEILNNADRFSADLTLNVNLRHEGDFTVVRFENAIDMNLPQIQNTSRQLGLGRIQQFMFGYGFTSYVRANDVFYIDLHFDNKFVIPSV